MTMDARTTYPVLPVGHWWTVRKRFVEAVPPILTISYLASALNIGDHSAHIAFVGFRALGIIDPSGKPTDRALAWIDDSLYSQVCKDIIKEIYPEELRSIIRQPLEDRDAVEAWFSQKTVAGHKHVQKMAQVYLLLAEANLDGQHKLVKQRPPASKHTFASNSDQITEPQVHRLNETDQVTFLQQGRLADSAPSSDLVQIAGEHVRTCSAGRHMQSSVNINLHIHIDTGCSPQAIDRILAQIDKYLQDWSHHADRE
jgi:hypothetical protein